MTPLTWQRLALAAGVSGAATWLVSQLVVGRGATPVPVPWTVTAVSLVAAAASLGSAWEVREFVHGKRPGLPALKAARIAVLAQASAFTGALVAGACGGYAVTLALDWGHAPRREVAIGALIAALGGVVLMVAGWIAERWCRVDPPSGDDDAHAEAV
jgi:hypothetical protein